MNAGGVNYLSNQSENGHLPSGTVRTHDNGDSKSSLAGYRQRLGNSQMSHYSQYVNNRHVSANGSIPNSDRDEYLENFGGVHAERVRSRSNPFLPDTSDVSLPYTSGRQSVERTKWLTYAKQLRSSSTSFKNKVLRMKYIRFSPLQNTLQLLQLNIA